MTGDFWMLVPATAADPFDTTAIRRFMALHGAGRIRETVPVARDGDEARPSTVPGRPFAAIEPTARIVDVPDIAANPLELSQLLGNFFLRKFLFDTRPMGRHDYFRPLHDPGTYAPLFQPTPMNPQGGAPILQPGLR